MNSESHISHWNGFYLAHVRPHDTIHFRELAEITGANVSSWNRVNGGVG